jgi:putative transposase
MEVSIPPKYSIAMVVGFLKGKSAIMLHREFCTRYKNYHGKSFWSRGYFISTVGADEGIIQNYILNQHQHDQKVDGNQLDMKW